MFCKKGVLRNFEKFLRTSFQRIPLVAASERVNADEAAATSPPLSPALCSVAVGKEDISGEA